MRAKSYRLGGKLVLPSNVVHIDARGVEDSRAPLFNGKFFRKYFEQELRQHLDKNEIRYPEDFDGGPPDGRIAATGRAMDLGGGGIGGTPGSDATPTGAAGGSGWKGEAEITLSKARTNIGRSVDVYRADGPLRRNDLVLTDETVSREHAHIIYDKAAGEYRLFNDRWYDREEGARRRRLRGLCETG